MTEEQAQVSVQTIGEMARLAGLHTEPDRVERLRDAHLLALEAVRELDDALPDGLSGAEGTKGFDAAWPSEGGGAS
jgi:hypothetical protein